MSTNHDVEIQTKLDECQHDSIGVTDWEQDFLDSTQEQLRANRRLSIKQEDLLEKIHAKRCG